MEANIENSNESLTCFSDEVEDVLAELNLKTDALDNPHFDVISYINELFPTEQSLAHIDEVIHQTEHMIAELDTEISSTIRGRWHSEDDGQQAVEEAMQMIQLLFTRICDVQDRATRSEEMVHDITKDIQQLDQAKRNLTVSITTLNNLILIVNALDRLNELLCINPRAGEAQSHASGKEDSTPNSVPDRETELHSGKTSVTNQGPGEFSLSFVSEVSNLVSQAQHLMRPMLAAYDSIPSVKGLARELDTIHSVLAEKVLRELKIMLAGNRCLTDNAPLIQAGCRLVGVLPDDLRIKSTLLTWFISRQLGEYRELFDPTQTAAWIDKVDHRYAWLRSNLPTIERKFQTVFPPDWHVTEELCVEFCRITKTDLETVMKRRQAELTHNLVIFGLQRTLAFESSLNKVYGTYKISANPERSSYDVLSNNKDKPKKSLNPFDDDEVEGSIPEERRSFNPPSTADERGPTDESGWKKLPFDGLISSCFDAHFDLYLNHVEKALHDQLHNRLIGDFTVNKSTFVNRESADTFKFAEGATSAPGSDSGENTLSSATELFLLYKQIVKQTLQLNRGSGFLGLVRILRQYLSEYAVAVLLAQVPGIHLPSLTTGPAGASWFAPDVTSKVAAFSIGGLSALGIGRSQTPGAIPSEGSKSHTRNPTVPSDQTGVSANQLFASLLRDDQPLARLTAEDTHRVCIILVTAAFCLKTVEDLERRLKLEVRPPNWSCKISFASEVDAFAACRSVCVHRLVSDLEAVAEPQLAAMARLPWNNVAHVGDQSVYVTEIVKHLRSQLPLIRDVLYSVRATFTQICIKFAGALISRFIASLYRCKPVNTFGAEQLLLDTQSLKSSLLQMPVLGAKFPQVPPKSFTNLVHEGMGRAERIIKAVMLPVGSSGLSSSSSTTTDTSNGFVMGPVDSRAAEVFLASYRQLLPDATPTDLQKVLEMKGVKASEQQIILDTFRSQYDTGRTATTIASINPEPNASATEADAERTKTSSQNQTTSVGPKPISQTLIDTAPPQSGRIRHLEKLVKKHR